MRTTETAMRPPLFGRRVSCARLVLADFDGMARRAPDATPTG